MKHECPILAPSDVMIFAFYHPRPKPSKIKKKIKAKLPS